MATATKDSDISYFTSSARSLPAAEHLIIKSSPSIPYSCLSAPIFSILTFVTELTETYDVIVYNILNYSVMLKIFYDTGYGPKHS